MVARFGGDRSAALDDLVLELTHLGLRLKDRFEIVGDEPGEFGLHGVDQGLYLRSDGEYPWVVGDGGV